jgi:8-oxo-dGTP pyrophosphatase MutT (NUDIX family)
MTIHIPLGTARFKQVGALPVRREKHRDPQVLLVTSRETRRWIIPKGWPMKGLKDHEAAAQEAREEGGVVGKIAHEPVGSFTYLKRRFLAVDLCEVNVYVLEVERQLKNWREKKQRDFGWFSAEEAAGLVQEPELAALIARVAAPRKRGAKHELGNVIAPS